MEKHIEPLFSIIMPVFNREKSIQVAIQSVLHQSYTNFELIIIDDASTDQTVNEIKRYNQPKIRLIQTAVNQGPAAARNSGIAVARGTYISFLDSDDELDPEFLKETAIILSGTPSNIGFMWTGMIWEENGRKEIRSWKPVHKGSSYLTFLHALHIGTNSGLTVKRTVFDTCGYFNTKLKAAEDTDFFLRITQHVDYVFTEKPLIHIRRDNKDRLSRNLKKNAEAYQLIFPKHQSIIDTSKFLQKKYYYKMMWLSFYLPDKKKAEYYFMFLFKRKLLTAKMSLIFLLYYFLPFKLASNLHTKQF
jgi:glycosyltransferase involved in cell wall biosynthesis